MISRGIRNNNPGNIRGSSSRSWQGEIGRDDAGFVVFDTPANGIRALAKLLISYQDLHGLNTVRGIINRWAPPVENDTGAYVAAVEASVGAGQIDVHNADTLYKLAVAIIKHENGSVPYTAEQVSAGVTDALGVLNSGTTVPVTGTVTAASGTQPAAPIEHRDTVAPKESRMPILALLSAFGPLIAQLLPVVGSFLTSDKAKANVDKAGIIFDTITQATKSPNLQAAVEAMQDPVTGKEAIAAARTAIVNSPAIAEFVEVGGGFAAAREADVKMQAAAQDTKPFYKTSAVFWISVLLLPMVLWYVGSSIVGGIDIPADWPWYAQLPLKLFGLGWSLDARAGLANLVVGLILGGICGVYFGISVTQAKQQTPATDTSKG